MSWWSCNFSGTCEENEVGQYLNRETCEAQCQGIEYKELIYSIATLNPEDALWLNASDQVQIIFRLTGVHLVHQRARDQIQGILGDIISETYGSLALDEEFTDWIRTRVTVYEWWAIQLLSHPTLGHINWKLVGLALHSTLQFYQLVEDEAPLAVIYNYVKEKVQKLGFRTVEEIAHLHQTFARLWPEMVAEYGLREPENLP